MSFIKIQRIDPTLISNPDPGHIYVGQDMSTSGFGGFWQKDEWGNIFYISSGNTYFTVNNITGITYIISGSTSSGFSGTSGTSGKSGSSGKDGFSGVSGTSGTASTSGISGSSGSSGKTGSSGYSGSSGSSGSSGFTGTSGSSGKDGSFYGSSGTSGFAGYGAATRIWIFTGDTMPNNGHFYGIGSGGFDLGLLNEIRLNKNDIDSVNLINWLTTWGTGIIKIENVSDLSNSAIYHVNGVTPYIIGNVVIISGLTAYNVGYSLIEGESYFISYVPSGYGTAGTSGMGSPGTSGSSGISGIPVSPNYNQLISGTVTWLHDLVFQVSDCVYYIQGVLYYSPSVEITLDPSDPLNPRLDLIYVSTSSVAGDLTGLPANDPAQPIVDPLTQLELTTILVPAGAFEPSGITEEWVYLENVEWNSGITTVTGGVTVNFLNTNAPKTGIYQTRVSKTVASYNGEVFRWVRDGLLYNAFGSTLVLSIRTSRAFLASSTIILTAKSYNTQVGTTVLIRNGRYGFVGSSLLYQTLAIPFSEFSTTATQINTLQVSFSGTWPSAVPTMNIDFDVIKFQNGITPPVIVNGTSGVSGSSGTSGTSATSGSSGTSGEMGTSGTSGSSGGTGNDGSSGTSGEMGTSGTSGVGSPGSSGTSGEKGTSGSSGLSGKDGSSGLSSPSIWFTPNSGVEYVSGSTSGEVHTIYNTLLDPTLTVPNAVGGITSGTAAGDLSGKTLVSLIDDLLFPTVLPTYTIPVIILSSSVTGIKEVGETISPLLTLDGTKNDASGFTLLNITRGSIISTTSSPTLSSATSIANQFGYIDPNNPNSKYTLTYTDTGYVIPVQVTTSPSSTVYGGNGNYNAGLSKKNNKGNFDVRSFAVRSVNAPQSGSTNFAASTITISGYYPYFFGKSGTTMTPAQIVSLIQSGLVGYTKVVNTVNTSVNMAFNAVGEWPWFVTFSSYANRTTWAEVGNPLNNGLIGTNGTDLFAAAVTLPINSPSGYWTGVNFKIYVSQKITTLGNCTIT